jgi:hypothetical protein
MIFTYDSNTVEAIELSSKKIVFRLEYLERVNKGTTVY